MASNYKKGLKKLLSAAVIITVILAVFSFGTTKIIYDSCFPRYDTVSADTNEITEAIFESKTKTEFISGKNRLTGYVFPAENGNTERLIVIAQGMNATYIDYADIINEFSRKGYGVFVFDPTGCGESEGDSAVGFPQMLNDLNAALEHLNENSRFGYDSIFLFGHSRGGYAACCATAYGHDITAVVSVNGINSAMEGVMMPAVKVMGNFAYGNYPMLWIYQAMLFGAKQVDASAVKALEQTQIPALIIHASGDQTVPDDRFSIVSHKDDTSGDSIVWLTDFGSNDGNQHTQILFDKNGNANSDLINTVTDFFDKAAAK